MKEHTEVENDALSNLTAARQSIEHHLVIITEDIWAYQREVELKNERIDELLKENDALEQSGETEWSKDYHRLEEVVAKNVEVYGDKLAEKEKVIKDLRSLNKSLRDRLAVYANLKEEQDSRYQPRDMASEFADWMIPNMNPVNMSAKDLMLEEGWKAVAEPKADTTAAWEIIKEQDRAVDDRMANVTRLATAALKHLEQGNTMAAEALIRPLAGGQHDTYDYYGDTDACGEARPDHDPSDIELAELAELERDEEAYWRNR